MGGAHLHTPQSIFQHMMSPQNTSQQDGSWLQMPQVPPLSIPWSVPALEQPELVRFTGVHTYAPVSHQKRKLQLLEFDFLDIRPTKQFITEEKMAAHFQDLHISSNYHPQPNVPSTSSTSTAPICSKSNMELDMDTPTKNNETKRTLPRLVLSEELKRLQQEPMLPTTLLSKLERPTMAVVLWEPPSKHLWILPKARDTPTPNRNGGADDNNNNNSSNNSNRNNSNSNNNNNEGIPDLNRLLPSNSIASTFEPMEL